MTEVPTAPSRRVRYEWVPSRALRSCSLCKFTVDCRDTSFDSSLTFRITALNSSNSSRGLTNVSVFRLKRNDLKIINVVEIICKYIYLEQLTASKFIWGLLGHCMNWSDVALLQRIFQKYLINIDSTDSLREFACVF